MACHQELRTSNRASDIVFMELEYEARALGANAIVGIDLDYEIILGKRAGISMERTRTSRIPPPH